jgi:hypothetical protein
MSNGACFIHLTLLGHIRTLQAAPTRLYLDVGGRSKDTSVIRKMMSLSMKESHFSQSLAWLAKGRRQPPSFFHRFASSSTATTTLFHRPGDNRLMPTIQHHLYRRRSSSTMKLQDTIPGLCLLWIELHNRSSSSEELIDADITSGAIEVPEAPVSEVQ